LVPAVFFPYFFFPESAREIATCPAFRFFYPLPLCTLRSRQLAPWIWYLMNSEETPAGFSFFIFFLSSAHRRGADTSGLHDRVIDPQKQNRGSFFFSLPLPFPPPFFRLSSLPRAAASISRRTTRETRRRLGGVFFFSFVFPPLCSPNLLSRRGATPNVFLQRRKESRLFPSSPLHQQAESPS